MTGLLVLIALHGYAAPSKALERVPDAQASSAVPLPPGLDGVGIEEHLGAELPRDLIFRDHTGATVRLAQYFASARPVVLTLMYHRCPMLCSLVLDTLTTTFHSVPWTVGKEFQVVTISIDPHDTPDIATRKRQQILARYGRREAEAGWHFLTGKEDSIQRIAQALGFHYRWDPVQEQYAHPAAVFVATGDGRIARYLYGVSYSPRDIRLALLEASEGKSVTSMERVLLFCYHYDATGRRYTSIATRGLRIGGLVLLLVLGGAFARLWLRERRDSRGP